MHNPRITRKELGLIKGALRRVFSRSELRRKVLESYTIPHVDETRPRVGKWGYCTRCGEVTPRYLLEIDHVSPLIGVTESLDDLSWDAVVDRLWCEESNLKPCCKPCHKQKSKIENKERRKYRKCQKT